MKISYSPLEGFLGVHISLDGDKWCALIGEDLQDGLAGFGNTPCEALRELVNQIEINQWDLANIALW